MEWDIIFPSTTMEKIIRGKSELTISNGFHEIGLFFLQYKICITHYRFGTMLSPNAFFHWLFALAI